MFVPGFSALSFIRTQRETELSAHVGMGTAGVGDFICRVGLPGIVRFPALTGGAAGTVRNLTVRWEENL